MAVFFACDCWVFISGRDSALQTHKTDAEKQIQQATIEKLRKDDD